MNSVAVVAPYLYNNYVLCPIKINERIISVSYGYYHTLRCDYQIKYKNPNG